MRLNSPGQGHPERKGSHGSCFLLTAVAHSAKEMVCPLAWKNCRRLHILTHLFPACLEKGCLEHFPCPAPSPKLVLPIHISVKTAGLLQKVSCWPLPPQIPNTRTSPLQHFLHSKLELLCGLSAASNGLQASSISPGLKIEPGSHRVLSKCSPREDKCHLVSPCHMQDQVLTEHTV